MTDRVPVDPALAARVAPRLLSSLAREYPNKMAHVLSSDADVRPPRELTPAFYGCFDWHSAVHSHWALARLARSLPDADFAEAGLAALERTFEPERIAGELRHLGAPGREGFERPYGLSWLLQLRAELTEWSHEGVEEPARWTREMGPLCTLAAQRLESWLDSLVYPVRSGEHPQSAFAIGLWLDSVPDAGAGHIRKRVLALYGSDRDGPLHLEPSGYDFLSPCLAEADLMRRVLGPEPFAAWLDGWLPALRDPAAFALDPVCCPDPSDGKLAHLDGLNLSRAWMLEGIAAGLPEDDPRRQPLLDAAARHATAGLAAVGGDHYAGTHWLGSFAVYLATGRGLPRTMA